MRPATAGGGPRPAAGGPPAPASRVAGLKDVARAASSQGRPEDALSALSLAVALEPGDAEAHGALGLVLQGLDRTREAFEAYHRAVTLDPGNALAYGNLAALLGEINQLDASITASRVAVALDPDYLNAYLNLGAALRAKGDRDGAAEVYARLLARDPANTEARVQLFHLRQHFYEWEGLAGEAAAILRASARTGQRVNPFVMLTATADPREQLLCARRWAATLKTAGAPPLSPVVPRPPGRRAARIRVGYLSADFYDHATAMLIVEMLELHDRGRFELFGYCLGNDDGGAMRRRLVAAFDHFATVPRARPVEAAQRIRADEIDILIDLKGYTKDACSEILACRPAPVQVNFLGYPGSMGAPFIDYIVADRVVVPPGAEIHYDEKVVRLPHCYQSNDRRRLVAETPDRAACGLPATGFVFACFNDTYKLTPEVVAIWLRLLGRTPGAVLWLLEGHPRSVAALRAQAERCGVAPARLVFAPRLPAARHMARMRLAGLFLDTLPVTAHTTASEALWVGLPVLTCLGPSFVARVAGSLLSTMGLEELVTTSLAAYEAKALALAQDPAALARLRAILDRNRAEGPLFDSRRYTRGFEAALVRMQALRDAGRPPESFDVDETANLPACALTVAEAAL